MAKKSKKKNQIFLKLIFILGLMVMLYPVVSRYYYRIEANEQVTKFDSAKSELTDEEVQRRIGLAHAFNESLNNSIEEDPYAEDRHAAGRAEYARMLELHEQMGHIEIPKINTDIPIYAGTAEEVLQKGAGHLEGTSLPVGGESTHTVITAHSGLPTAKLFTDLNKVEIGDHFYIHNLEKTLAYEVDQILTVEPSNFNDLLIVPGQDYATLLTCTPIMINSHRLLVRGHSVPYVEKEKKEEIEKGKGELWKKYAMLGIAILLFIFVLLSKRRKKKKALEAKKRAALSERMNSKNVSNNSKGLEGGNDGKE
ncbi:class C sortase [Peptoniphilus asaccharolyticus]